MFPYWLANSEARLWPSALRFKTSSSETPSKTSVSIFDSWKVRQGLSENLCRAMIIIKFVPGDKIAEVSCNASFFVFFSRKAENWDRKNKSTWWQCRNNINLPQLLSPTAQVRSRISPFLAFFPNNFQKWSLFPRQGSCLKVGALDSCTHKGT